MFGILFKHFQNIKDNKMTTVYYKLIIVKLLIKKGKKRLIL